MTIVRVTFFLILICILNSTFVRPTCAYDEPLQQRIRRFIANPNIEGFNTCKHLLERVGHEAEMPAIVGRALDYSVHQIVPNLQMSIPLFLMASAGGYENPIVSLKIEKEISEKILLNTQGTSSQVLHNFGIDLGTDPNEDHFTERFNITKFRQEIRDRGQLPSFVVVEKDTGQVRRLKLKLKRKLECNDWSYWGIYPKTKAIVLICERWRGQNLAPFKMLRFDINTGREIARTKPEDLLAISNDEQFSAVASKGPNEEIILKIADREIILDPAGSGYVRSSHFTFSRDNHSFLFNRYEGSTPEVWRFQDQAEPVRLQIPSHYGEVSAWSMKFSKDSKSIYAAFLQEPRWIEVRRVLFLEFKVNGEFLRQVGVVAEDNIISNPIADWDILIGSDVLNGYLITGDSNRFVHIRKINSNPDEESKPILSFRVPKPEGPRSVTGGIEQLEVTNSNRLFIRTFEGYFTTQFSLLPPFIHPL